MSVARPIYTPDLRECIAVNRLVKAVDRQINTGSGRRPLFLVRAFKNTHGFNPQAEQFIELASYLGIQVPKNREMASGDYFDLMRKGSHIHVFYKTHNFHPGINISSYHLRAGNNDQPTVELVTKDVHISGSSDKTIILPDLIHLSLAEELVKTALPYPQQRSRRFW